LSATLQKRAPIPRPITVDGTNALNAENVTVVATNFLKRIGNKGHLKPKKVSLKEKLYTVEVEMKKLTAIVRVDSETREIKEYEIQARGEEAPLVSLSPKTLIIMIGISAVIFVALHSAFRMIGF
jgi:hypothetical protein